MPRKKANIDKEMFENMCSIFATQDEICQVFSIDRTTLYRWVKRTYKQPFATVLHAHAGKGKISLRRTQFKLAQNNPQLAIWLGKQYLNQIEPRDPQDTIINQNAQKVEIIIKDESNKTRIEKMENKIIDDIKGR